MPQHNVEWTGTLSLEWCPGPTVQFPHDHAHMTGRPPSMIFSNDPDAVRQLDKAVDSARSTAMARIAEARTAALQTPTGKALLHLEKASRDAQQALQGHRNQMARLEDDRRSRLRLGTWGDKDQQALEFVAGSIDRTASHLASIQAQMDQVRAELRPIIRAAVDKVKIEMGQAAEEEMQRCNRAAAESILANGTQYAVAEGVALRLGTFWTDRDYDL
jgi:hypothetical protein